MYGLDSLFSSQVPYFRRRVARPNAVFPLETGWWKNQTSCPDVDRDTDDCRAFFNPEANLRRGKVDCRCDYGAARAWALQPDGAAPCAGMHTPFSLCAFRQADPCARLRFEAQLKETFPRAEVWCANRAKAASGTLK